LDGCLVAIQQSSLYPDSGSVTLEIQLELTLPFTLRLRIPYHDRETKIQLNGNPFRVEPGADGYYPIRRQWSAGDRIVMEFDVPTEVRHFLNDRYGILVRGAEVLTLDQRDNASLDLDRVVLQEGMALKSIDPMDGRRRYLGEGYVKGQPEQVIFTPYADCGGDGSRFRTAFPVSASN